MVGGGGDVDVFVWVFVKGHVLIRSRNWKGHNFFRQIISKIPSLGLHVGSRMLTCVAISITAHSKRFPHRELSLRFFDWGYLLLLLSFDFVSLKS